MLLPKYLFKIFEFAAHECGTLTGFAVLEIDNEESFSVHVDTHTDFDICCCCHTFLFCFLINYVHLATNL